MTALCGGGTSGPKAGYAAVVDFGIGQLVNLLVARNLRWLIPAVPLAPLPNLTLASFCASDPPANPTFTTAETLAILGLQFGADFDSGISKLKDLLLRTVWYEACQCNSGSLTAYPTITPPTGTPINVEPTPGTNAPCASWGPHTVTSFVGPSFGLFTNQPIRYVTLTVTNTITSGSGTNGSVVLSLWLDDYPTPGPGTLLDSKTMSLPAGQTSQLVVPCPFGTNFVRPDFTLVSGTGVSSYVYTIAGFCQDGPPNAVSIPCCPPDAATAATLALILEMVTLQQRQTAPFAYVYGTNHTGLTGNGQLTVGGLIGVSVDVTALPSSQGRIAGTPEHLLEVGWLTLGTADGWLKPRQIDADGTLELCPPGAGAVTRIGYTLAPGVTIAVRELVREP